MLLHTYPPPTQPLRPGGLGLGRVGVNTACLKPLLIAAIGTLESGARLESRLRVIPYFQPGCKKMSRFMVLITMLLLAVSAFGSTSAALVNENCKALHATGADANSPDRNSNLGMCLGYMNAVLDSIENDGDIEVIKDFIVADMIRSFEHYAPQHYAESAKKAIVNAMIADGYLRQKARDKNDPCGIR